jgi:hypothetical protein
MWPGGAATGRVLTGIQAWGSRVIASFDKVAAAYDAGSS